MPAEKNVDIISNKQDPEVKYVDVGKMINQVWYFVMLR